MKKQKIKKKTLRAKVLPVLLLAIFIPILAALVLMVRGTTELLEQRIEKQEMAVTESVVTLFEGVRQEAEDTIHTLATSPALLITEDEAFNREASLLRDGGQYVLDIYYAQPGQTTLRGTFLGEENYDPATREWYQEAIAANGELYWTQPYFDEIIQANVMTVSKAIFQEGNLIGILAMDITFEEIGEEVAATQIGTTGYAFVVSETGEIVMSGNQAQIGTSIADSLLFTTATEQTGLIDDAFNDNSFGIYYKKLDSLDLVIYGAVSANEMDAENHTFLKVGSVILVAGAIFAIGISLFFTDYLGKITQAFQKAFSSAQAGDLSTKLTMTDLYRSKIKAELDANGNEIHQMGLSYNKTMAVFGDTVALIQEKSDHIFEMSENLNEIAGQTNSATEEVSTAIAGIAESTNHQTEETSTTFSKMEELNHALKELEEKITEMGGHADKTILASGKNTTSMDAVSENWTETMTALENLNNSIRQVDSDIQNIESITNTIKQIAEQTNLLALNASIEAARAGEAGRGFSVVAEEIRKLAEQSSHSSNGINDIITSVQENSNGMVRTLATVFTESKKQTFTISEAMIANTEVTSEVEQLVENIIDTFQLNEQMKVQRNEVMVALANISASAEENAASTEEVSASAEEILATMEEFSANIANLEKLAMELKASADYFKLGKVHN